MLQSKKKNTFSWVGGYCRVWDLILLYLQTNKLACYCFMDSGWRHKTLWLETQNTITHGTARSMSVSIFTNPWVSLVPKAHQHITNMLRLIWCTWWVNYTDLEESTAFWTNSKQAYSLSGEIYLPLLTEEIKSLIIS